MLGAGIGRDANERDVLVGNCHHGNYFERTSISMRTCAEIGERNGSSRKIRVTTDPPVF
jgi:hypothetical protein